MSATQAPVLRAPIKPSGHLERCLPKPLTPTAHWLYVLAIAVTFTTALIRTPGPPIVKAIPGSFVLGLAVLLTPAPAFRKIRIDPILLLLICWCVATIGWSVDRIATIQNLAREVPRIATVTIAISIIGVRRAREGLALIFIGFIVATYVTWIIDPVGSTTPAEGDYTFGLRGLFSHKNTLAKVATITILLVLSMPWSRWKRGAVIAASAIVLQQSTATTALFATVGGALIFLWLTLTLPSKRFQSYFRFLSLVGAVAMSALVVLFFLPQAVSATGKDLTLTGRTEIWSAVIPIIKGGSVRGYGFGAVWEHSSPIAISAWRTVGFFFSDSHSVIFEMLLHTGIIGLVIMVSWWASTINRAAAGLRRDPATSGWVLATIFALTVISFTDAMYLGGWLPLYAVLAAATRGLDERDVGGALTLRAPT